MTPGNRGEKLKGFREIQLVIPLPVKFDTSYTKREAQAKKELADLACAWRLVWSRAGSGIVAFTHFRNNRMWSWMRG